MSRYLLGLPLLLLAGCAEPSRGVALNQCHLQNYLQSQAEYGALMTDCMKARSFSMTAACTAVPAGDNWHWSTPPTPYDNPDCYQPVGGKASVATTLSPL